MVKQRVPLVDLKLTTVVTGYLELEYRSGGGFFLACEDFGKMFDESFSDCAVSFSFYLFNRWEKLAHNKSTLFRSGSVHSGSAS